MNKNVRFVSPKITELDKLRQPLTRGEEIVFNYFNKNLTSDWDIYIQPHIPRKSWYIPNAHTHTHTHTLRERERYCL